MHPISFRLAAFAAFAAAAPLQDALPTLTIRPPTSASSLPKSPLAGQFRPPQRWWESMLRKPTHSPTPTATFTVTSTVPCSLSTTVNTTTLSCDYFPTAILSPPMFPLTGSLGPPLYTPTMKSIQDSILKYGYSATSTTTSTSIPGCRWTNAAKCSLYSSLHYEATHVPWHTPFAYGGGGPRTHSHWPTAAPIPSPATIPTRETPTLTSSGDELWVVLETGSGGLVRTYVTDVQPTPTLTPEEWEAFPCKSSS
jgi:hypothetical protein